MRDNGRLMNPPHHPVRVEELDLTALFPWTGLAGAFRLALAPSRLLMALLFVVLVYAGGRALDAGPWGAAVHPGEIERFGAADAEAFEKWLAAEAAKLERDLERRLVWLPEGAEGFSREAATASFEGAVATVDRWHRGRIAELETALAEAEAGERAALEAEFRDVYRRWKKRRADLAPLRPRGVFTAALGFKLDAFDRLVRAAAGLRLGLAEFRGVRGDGQSVVASLRDLAITLPGWLLVRFPGFLLLYALGALAAWSLLGGAMARSIAIEVTRERRIGPGEAVSWAASRWGWLVLAPLLPLLLAGAVALGLAGGGLLLNLPLLDIVAGFLFGLAILGGLGVALVLVGGVAGMSLMQPALAVEDIDAFDAVSRAYHYVFGRPGRWLFYQGVALLFGMAGYLFVGLVIFLGLLLTHRFVGAGVMVEAAGGGNRFDAFFPAPELGKLAHPVDWTALGASGKVAGALICVWVYLAIGLLGAWALTFYQATQTWIYLLLRQASDGTALDEIFLVGEDDAASSPEP